MLKPKAVLKAYGADAQDDGQMEKEIFLECISNLALRLGRSTDTLEDPPNKNRRPNQGGGQSIFYMR